MTKRKTDRSIRAARRNKRRTRQSKNTNRRRHEIINKSGYVIKRPRSISDKRLEKGLRVLNETGDFSTAARSISFSPEKFKRAAKRKGAIRKRNDRWKVVSSLPRRMPVFSDGKQLAITVRSRTAALIGRYMSVVGQFLRTNKIKVLSEYKGMSVKDINGKTYPLETDANVLYRLASAGGEPFHEIYRIVL